MAVPADQIDHIEIVATSEQRDPKEHASAAAPISPEELVSAAAEAQGLDQAFVRSVAKVESDFRQDAVSSKGALGIMQLMPGTAAGLGVNGKDAAENAAGGAKYLRQLLLQYHGNAALALAAYNAGPQAVARYGGIPPYLETREYVLRVIREYERQMKRKPEAAAAEKPSTAP